MDAIPRRERSAAPFLVASILAKPIGFLREMVVAAVYGSGITRDAFLIAWQVPNFVGSAVTEGLPQTLVPHLAENAHRDGDRDHEAGLLLVLVWVFAALSLVTFLTAPALVGWVAPFAPEATQRTAVALLRILAVTTLLLGASAVLSALLLARRRFVQATLAVPLMNLVVIATVLVGQTELGIGALAWGTVAGTAAMTLWLVPGTAIRLRLPRRADAPHYWRFAALLGPFLFGTLLFNLNAVAERAFASTLAPGAISNLDYGFRLVQMIFTLLAVLPTYLFPRLCDAAAAGADRDEWGRILARGSRATLAIALPLAAFVWAAREPLVQTIYQRGAFDDTAARATATLVGWYALGLTFHALDNLFIHGFYAVRAMRVRFAYGAVFLTVNVGLNFVLVRQWGAPALAFANTAAAAVCCVLLATLLARRDRGALRGVGLALVRGTVWGAILALAVTAIVSIDGVAPAVRLAAAAAAALVVLGVSARRSRDDGLLDVWRSVVRWPWR